jgi:hypothetical protein
MTFTFRMVDGDLFFDVNGRLDEVTDFGKVSQDLAEILLTHLDIDRDFGSELVLTDSSPQFNISESQVTSYVLDAVERLRGFQRTNQYTTQAEEIAAIEQIEVYKNDQTEILFGLSVLTSSGLSVETGARLAQEPVALNHLLPPGKSQQDQEYKVKAANPSPVITGETSNGS